MAPAVLVVPLALTALLVTHTRPERPADCSRSVVVNEGRIVADGPTVELLADEALLTENRLVLPMGQRVGLLTSSLIRTDNIPDGGSPAMTDE